MPTRSVPLWDIPTRVFHWLLVACLPLAWWSAEEEYYSVHEWTGCAILVLVITRIVWGFVGSRHSRFTDFLVGPARLLAYLQGQTPTSPGHNPAGGWSVVLLLALLLIQAGSGLFNSDDVLFSGPLHFWASTGFRDAMGIVHDIAFNTLLALAGLHILAVVYHQMRLKEKLLQAMVYGSAAGRAGTALPVAWWRAVLVAAVVALLLWLGIEQAPKPELLAW